MEINMNYCIGVDLGGTNIAAGIVDLQDRKIVRKMSVKTNAPRPCEDICADIAKLCRDLCSAEGIKLSDLKWIGVATPGIVKDGVVVTANNLGWDNVDFAGIMKRLAGNTTFVANDANAAAYAEAIWGVGAGHRSLAAITLGTGVGGGLVIDGQIWEGMNGFAAEMGHTTIAVDGRYCSCGRRGCLEAYCSASALVSEARRIMKLYPDSVMWQMCDGDVNRVNGVIPFKAAERGDVAASAVIADFIKYLAIGASNVINIFQPDVVCIGGGISGEGERLLKPLREQIERLSFGVKDGRTKVVAAKFMNDAGILGGALLGMQEEIVKMKEKHKALVSKFDVEGIMLEAKPYGNGHINDTKYILMESDGEKHEYILQKINKNVFKKPDELMENYVGVTSFLREIIIKNGGDPERETINVIKARDGLNYHIDEDGEYWRLCKFVNNSMSYDKVECPDQFYSSAVAFGNFQYLLRDFPADTLVETIKDFHNTPDRFNKFLNAVNADAFGRRALVEPEIEFVKAREQFMHTLEIAHKDGRLPLRVTHNDTKLNNILMDAETNQARAVID